MTSTSSHVGIIADDLTGGAAIGGEIARLGHPVDVVGLGQATRPGRSIVVETGTRYSPPGIAVERLKKAAEILSRAGTSLTMKKIDSTLKGNVAIELAAFAANCRGRLLIAPACPEVGLTLRDGQQFTPRGPGRNVLELLSSSLDGPLAHLKLNTVRQGRQAVTDWLQANPDGTVVADAETDADLAILAAGAAEAGIVSFGGTYGLGAALATAYLRRETKTRYIPPTVPGMLVVAGSASATTAAQLAQLVEAGAEEIVLDMERILAGGEEEEAQRATGQIHSSTAKLLVVHTDAERTGQEVVDHCRRFGWNERDLADRLAIPFAQAMEAAAGHAIYLIGGETTGAIFDKLGLNSLTIEGECSPAVPFAVTIPRSKWPLILTKPGAFGTKHTLVETAELILGSRESTVHTGQDNHHPSIR